MRPDMTKVITERPRAGPRLKTQKGERKRLQRGTEELPLRESTARRRKPCCRGLTDLLGPLQRFLERNAGRPWDKVYSEIRAQVHPRKQVELHILDHVEGFVERAVVMVGKVPHRRTAWYDGSTELWAPFYVHPVHGLLLKNRHRRRRSRHTTNPGFLKMDDSRQLRILDELWFEVKLEPIPPDQVCDGRCLLRDALTGRRGNTMRELSERYGGNLYAARKRQLGKREIKRWRPEAARLGLIEPA